MLAGVFRFGLIVDSFFDSNVYTIHTHTCTQNNKYECCLVQLSVSTSVFVCFCTCHTQQTHIYIHTHKHMTCIFCSTIIFDYIYTHIISLVWACVTPKIYACKNTHTNVYTSAFSCFSFCFWRDLALCMWTCHTCRLHKQKKPESVWVCVCLTCVICTRTLQKPTKNSI
jgi:hypothetical protein